MPWQAALAALGGGVLGGMQARQYQKALRGIGKKNERDLVRLQAENRLLEQKSLADVEAARATVKGGFRRARGSTRGAFLRAERGVQLGARAAMDATESNLLQSGRANTALLNLARQGVNYNTALQLQEIARTLSGSLTSLDIGEAQADAGLQLGRAGVRSQAFGNKVGLQRSIHAARLGQVPEPIDGSAGFGALADLFESLFSDNPAQAAPSTQATADDFDPRRDDGTVGGVS